MFRMSDSVLLLLALVEEGRGGEGESSCLIVDFDFFLVVVVGGGGSKGKLYVLYKRTRISRAVSWDVAEHAQRFVHLGVSLHLGESSVGYDC